MKYLIAGVSGSGKSTVRRILEKKGYRCIDIDAEPGLSNWYHKKTGVVGKYTPGIGSAWIEQHHWLWDEQKMKSLLAVDPTRPVFVCGLTSDILDRFNLFDKVFMLQIPAETVRTRLMERPADEFGKGEDEISYTVSWQKEWEEKMIAKGAIPINATQLPEKVVKDILFEINDEHHAGQRDFVSSIYAIVIRGPLGVGKTTVAEQLAEQIGGKYFSIDLALEMSGGAKSEGDYAPDDFIRAQEYILPQVQRSLREGYTVVLDGNFYFEEQIQHLKWNIMESLHIFTLRASLEECIARDRMRTHSFGEESARAIYAMVSKLVVGIPVDTEHKRVDDIVDEIFHQIKRSE